MSARLERRSRRRRAITWLVLAAGLATGCLDGPFAHDNPYDADHPMTLEIVGGADTLRVAGEIVQYQLRTDPVVEGVLPHWESSAPSVLVPGTRGRYLVSALPLEPLDVTISAGFGANVAFRTVTLMPAAP